MSRLYPIGIQYFEKIGEGNMLMWKDCMGLSTGVGGDYYFLSRPCGLEKAHLFLL